MGGGSQFRLRMFFMKQQKLFILLNPDHCVHAFLIFWVLHPTDTVWRKSNYMIESQSEPAAFFYENTIFI